LDTATAVEIQGNEISLSMMNGWRIIAPIWLFFELEGMNSEDLNDVELIEGGSGILIGDKEAVTVRRIVGMESSAPAKDDDSDGSGFGFF